MKALTFALIALALTPLAAPAQALDPATLTGQWRGAGMLSLPGQPDQRLRCDLGFAPSTTPGRSFLRGRCATAQGGQSFHYRLDARGGTLSATREPDAPEDLPQTLDGQMAGQTLRLTGPDVDFLLTRDGEALTFTLSAPGQEGVARATLTLR